MNDQEKFEAILNSNSVSPNILATNVYKLMYGNLSHIGAALLNGSTILFDDETGPHHFNGSSRDYTIKQPTVIFNGCEINAPVNMMDIDDDCLVFIVNIETIHNTRAGAVLASYFKYGLVFRTEEDAQAYRKAAGWVV